jgi:hypothetical protein
LATTAAGPGWKSIASAFDLLPLVLLSIVQAGETVPTPVAVPFVPKVAVLAPEALVSGCG